MHRVSSFCWDALASGSFPTTANFTDDLKPRDVGGGGSIDEGEREAEREQELSCIGLFPVLLKGDHRTHLYAVPKVCLISTSSSTDK